MKVLVVDDDTVLAEYIRMGLREHGHAVDVAHTGAHGRTLAMVHDYDAIVLDYVLPDVTGLDVLRDLRSRGRTTPVVMLTARSGSEDVVQGLDTGADDYLGKPFEMAVLEARLRAAARRAAPARGGPLALGDVTADRLRRVVTAAGRTLSLAPREYMLLEHMLQNPERVVTRTELLEKVWEMHFDPGSNVVDVHVSRIRTKLRQAGSRVRLATLRGAGYMLTATPDGDAGE